MSHKHNVKVVNFVGYDEVLAVAIEKATQALNLWYVEQDILWYSDGGSVWQMSASTLYHEREYTYIISVFDTRKDSDR